MSVLKLYNPLKVSEDEVKQYLDLLVKLARMEYALGLNVTPHGVVECLRAFRELERFKLNYEGPRMSFEQAFSVQLFEELGYAVWVEDKYETKNTNPFGNYYVGKLLESEKFICDVTTYLTTIKGSDGFEGIELFQNTVNEEKPIDSVTQHRTNSVYYFQFD